MSRRTLRLAAAPVLVVLVLASCSSDDDDNSSDTTAASPDASLIEPATTAADGGDDDAGMVAGTPDPCALITPAGIAVVLGEPAPTGTQAVLPQPPLNLRQCEWSTEDGRAIFLSVQTTEGFREGNLGGGAYGASDQYEATRSALPTAVDITGLGDAAFYADPTEHKLSVLAGDAFLEIIGAEGTTGEQLRALMEEALAAV